MPDLPPPAAAGSRLLVADDNAAGRGLLRAILESAGFEVEAAADGLAALEALERVRFDLVLMDLQMPRMGGLEATAAIRSRHGGHPRLPVIAMTASTEPDARGCCLAAGMDDFIAKPAPAARILERVRWWLDHSRARPAA